MDINLRSKKIKRKYFNGNLVSIVKEIIILSEIDGKFQMKYKKILRKNDSEVKYYKKFSETNKICDNYQDNNRKHLFRLIINYLNAMKKNNQKSIKDMKSNYKVIRKVLKILKTII